MEFRWKIGILLLLPIITLQFSDVSSPSYIAAVVEYHPITQAINDEQPADINAKNYIKFIKKASNYSADIIVFPESSLSIPTTPNRGETASYIPDPEDNIIICDNDTYAYSLRTISCAARDSNIYVVINHHEKVDCLQNTTNCPSDKLLIYNTNIAFDRKGKVIARYRKYNLFGEFEKNITDINVLSTFETDFNVTFGQFICFDLLFPQPALNLTRQLGITDIIYSSHWFSELPFLYSIQAQAGWSYVNDVNFLSAGYNNPATISGGSGIFIGRQGYSHVIMEPKAVNILVVSEIPKVINNKRLLTINKEKLSIYEFNKDEISTSGKIISAPYVPLVNDLSIFTTKMIDLTKQSYDEVLCDRGFCCDFKFNFTFDNSIVKDNKDYYKYRLAVFNGTRSFSGVATGGIKTCGIITCTTDHLDSCGKLLNTTIFPTTFHSIQISIRNTSNDNVFFMPVSISSNLIPLNVTDYTFDTNDFADVSTHNIVLKKERNDLLTFAIFGRNFATDGMDVTTNSSYVHYLSLPLIIIVTVLMYFCQIHTR